MNSKTGPTLFTVGHGERKNDDLVALLRDAGAVLLAGVRRHARSRRHLHFARGLSRPGPSCRRLPAIAAAEANRMRAT
jgi:hypothetical protein